VAPPTRSCRLRCRILLRRGDPQIQSILPTFTAGGCCRAVFPVDLAETEHQRPFASKLRDKPWWLTCNRHHRLCRHAPPNDPGHYRLSCSNALPRAVRPTAAVRKRVSTDMVLAQQFTRHIAGWSAFARKFRQALLPGRDAFAHLDQAIHLPKSVTCM
jgi:hypothetical protein